MNQGFECGQGTVLTQVNNCLAAAVPATPGQPAAFAGERILKRLGMPTLCQAVCLQP